MDITGFGAGLILPIRWEIVEKALFEYSDFDQILIFFNPRLLGKESIFLSGYCSCCP